MSVDLSKITDSSSVAKSKDSVVGIGATATRATAQAHPDEGIDPNDKHLCTDHLLTNLKGRTISGAFITIVAQGAGQVIQWTTSAEGNSVLEAEFHLFPLRSRAAI